MTRRLTLTLSEVEANVILAALDRFTAAIPWADTIEFFGTKQRGEAAWRAYRQIGALFDTTNNGGDAA